MIRINKWTNQRRGFREFSSGSPVNPQSARYGGTLPFLQMCVAPWKFTRRAHRKLILCSGGVLQLYVALRLFNLHLQSALL